jgi:hypothetical protein
MRITEIIQSKPASAMTESVTQDVVPQDSVSEECVSAIAEGVSQILRRVKGKGLKPGFRCTSGPRKGRIVAKPSTCFMRRDSVKGAKIAKKRQLKARTAGRKMAITKRSGGASRKLKRSQIKTGTRLDRPSLKSRPRLKARPLAKYNKIARPK